MIKEHPYFLVAHDFPTVEQRISMFMSTIEDGEHFNEYDFLELCRDLIKSKKDKFKSIKKALERLLDRGYIWKEINKLGEPVYSSPWGRLNSALRSNPDAYKSEEIEWPETELEQKIREFHNVVFNCRVPHNWQRHLDDGAIPEGVLDHYVGFRDALMKVIKEYQNPTTFIPWSTRIFIKHTQLKPDTKKEHLGR